MRAGDILLFQGKGMMSRLIRWGTRSPYSHVAVSVSPEMNLCIEACSGGVRARDIRKIKDFYEVYRVKEGYSYELDKVITFLVDKLNRRYDFFGVFWLGFLKFLRLIGLRFLEKMSNEWQRSRDYFCSELCYEAFWEGGGLDIVPDVDEAAITSPGDIAMSSVVEIAK